MRALWVSPSDSSRPRHYFEFKRGLKKGLYEFQQLGCDLALVFAQIVVKECILNANGLGGLL